MASTPSARVRVSSDNPAASSRSRNRVFATSGFIGPLSGRRTTQLSSRGGAVSYEPRKAYMPPRSAAAPGSACLCWLRLEPIRGELGELQLEHLVIGQVADDQSQPPKLALQLEDPLAHLADFLHALAGH